VTGDAVLPVLLPKIVWFIRHNRVEVDTVACGDFSFSLRQKPQQLHLVLGTFTGFDANHHSGRSTPLRDHDGFLTREHDAAAQ